MNHFQRLLMAEHKQYVDHTSKILPFSYKICVRLSKRPTHKGLSTEESFHKIVNTLFLTLSKRSGIHIAAIIGYNDVVIHREPHFHALVLADKMVTCGILADKWSRFQNKCKIDKFIGKRFIAGDTNSRKGIFMQPYNLGQEGIIYCGVKHKPLTTTVWCPNHRNKTVSCGGEQERFNCRVHKHLCKATI